MTEEKCKVCGHPYPLNETFCPECGFERHVLPQPVTKEVEEYENKRIKVFQERREQSLHVVSDLKHQLAKKGEENDNIEKKRQSLLRQLDEQLKESHRLKDALKEMKEAYNAEVSGKKNLKKQISQLEFAANIVEAQRTDLTEKLKKANDRLATEIETHKRTKIELEQLRASDTQVEPKPQPHPRPVPTQPQGEPVARMVFSSGSKKVQENIFDGSNSYAIPSSMNSPVTGDAFRIDATIHKTLRLYDLCGFTRRINGDLIGTKGLQLYDKDYFTVGPITIRVILPKSNLRDFFK